MKCHTPNCLNKRVPGYPVCQGCMDACNNLMGGLKATDQELKDMDAAMRQAEDMFRNAGRGWS